jgi:hypothetical protein
VVGSTSKGGLRARSDWKYLRRRTEDQVAWDTSGGVQKEIHKDQWWLRIPEEENWGRQEPGVAESTPGGGLWE